MFPHFLVAIADLTHPLSNNRSLNSIIDCSLRQRVTPCLETVMNSPVKAYTGNIPLSQPRCVTHEDVVFLGVEGNISVGEVAEIIRVNWTQGTRPDYISQVQ